MIQQNHHRDFVFQNFLSGNIQVSKNDNKGWKTAQVGIPTIPGWRLRTMKGWTAVKKDETGSRRAGESEKLGEEQEDGW